MTVEIEVAFQTARGIYYLGDALEVLPGLDERSVDIVFTDPPFFMDDEGPYGNYGSYASALPHLHHVMKPDGWLLVYFPSNKLDLILRDTTVYFEYVDRFVVLYPQSTTKGAFGGKRTLELLVFKKGAPRTGGRMPIDVLDGIDDPLLARRGPRGSLWKPTLPTAILLGQVLAWDPDTVVLDPFAGYGSIPAVAEALGLRWIAIDIDPEKAAVARDIIATAGRARPIEAYFP
ncbi:DNA methyltransferase [Conexivisphaera calida]|uniref:Type II methyltransferase n=1 Tax=Conexivisphaera calida TaxID=1874277 RepID=A0A4P2VNF1_9ARCH|nr:DNA methyltransferase [Conexivisphaera calida]BBE42455.1 hypothetical protein NAS2_1066 [Conexivisphaera calida]